MLDPVKQTTIDPEKMKQAISLEMQALGEDSPDSLEFNAERVCKWRTWVFQGLQNVYPGGLKGGQEAPKTFPKVSTYGAIGAWTFKWYAICEHHYAPARMKAFFAYMPQNEIIGVTEVGKLLLHLGQRPILDERVADQFIDQFEEWCHPKGTFICVAGMHFCAIARRLADMDDILYSTAFSGVYSDPLLRMEAMAYAGLCKTPF